MFRHVWRAYGADLSDVCPDATLYRWLKPRLHHGAPARQIHQVPSNIRLDSINVMVERDGDSDTDA